MGLSNEPMDVLKAPHVGRGELETFPEKGDEIR